MTGLIDTQARQQSLTRFRVLGVVVFAAAVLAVLQWGMMRASERPSTLRILLLFAAPVLVAVAVGIGSNRKAGAAILVAAGFWAINELLLQLDYVTFLNFGQFAAISAFGEFIVRFTALAVIAIVLLLCLEARNQIWFYIVVVLLLLASIPSRWTDDFHI